MLLSHFLKIRRKVYLDNNATTSVLLSVARRMNHVLRKHYGNPSSLSHDAIKSSVIIDDSRAVIAETVNADRSEIFFTGSASEANNAVIKSLAEHSFPAKKKILSTPIEHASVMSSLAYLEQKGFSIEYIPVDSKGRVLIESFQQMIDEATFLVCCMLANNEIGVIQDIKQITEIAHSKQVPVFSDCVQALGKIPVDLKELNVDYASFSAHKIHGPKGVGAMYVNSGSFISSFIHGGHQENGLRAGTESIHNIAGFAEACKNVKKNLKLSVKTKLIKDFFINELIRIKPDIILNSVLDENCLPNTVNVVFTGVNNAALMAALDYFGIAVSAGSACNTQSNDASHVLKAIGLTDQQTRESIRFSLPADISKSQIKYVLSILEQAVSEKLPSIGMLEPKQLNEELINHPDTLIVDVRFWHDRLIVKGIPNSREINFFAFKKYFKHFPLDKNIILVCQGGFFAPIIGYAMKQHGYKNVQFLMLGIIGWQKANPELYNKIAGKNIIKL